MQIPKLSSALQYQSQELELENPAFEQVLSALTAVGNLELLLQFPHRQNGTNNHTFSIKHS